MENPAFCFSQTGQIDQGCANFSLGQAGRNDMGSDLQIKKKRSTPVCLQKLCDVRPENATKCAARHVVIFFFFFGDHPFFLFFRRSSSPSKIKSRTEFERPDFVIKIIEMPINLASSKVAIHCPDFCFSRYGNPRLKRI